jgi:hypothetical protein
LQTFGVYINLLYTIPSEGGGFCHSCGMARSVEKSGINVLPASRRDASLRDAKEVGACDFSTERPHPYGMARQGVLYKSLFEKIY